MLLFSSFKIKSSRPFTADCKRTVVIYFNNIVVGTKFKFKGTGSRKSWRDKVWDVCLGSN
jgi:hypothetical protein